MRNYAYLRVSTDLQDHGVDAQRTAIGNAVVVDEWFEEHASGKDIEGRPVFQEILDRACKDQACIVVAKLDRLGRSVIDVLNTFEQVKNCGASIKVLDMGIDTSTPAGEMMLTVLAAFAQFERRMIGERTKAGLAAARAKGVQLGRPRQVDHAAVWQAIKSGYTHEQVAEHFGISTRTVYRIIMGAGE
jgi:putative DNA-invertase from lambdoid prophage Rac